jgi:hypothetical protein
MADYKAKKERLLVRFDLLKKDAVRVHDKMTQTAAAIAECDRMIAEAAKAPTPA